MEKHVEQSYMFKVSISFSFPLCFHAKDQVSIDVTERTKADKYYGSAAGLLGIKDLFLLFVFKIWHKVGF